MVTRRAFLRSGVVWTGLLWIPKAAAQQSALAHRVGTFSKLAPSSGETLWVEQTVDNEYWALPAEGLSQRIKNGSARSITKIECKIGWTSDCTVKLKLTSNVDGTGTQYGSDSSTVDVTSAGYGTAAWATFTFGTPASVSGDFSIHMGRTGGGVIKWRMDYNHVWGAAYYPYIDATEDENYCGWNGTNPVGHDDFCFKIYTQ
jgi:hypothetical protein